MLINLMFSSLRFQKGYSSPVSVSFSSLFVFLDAVTLLPKGNLAHSKVVMGALVKDGKEGRLGYTL